MSTPLTINKAKCFKPIEQIVNELAKKKDFPITFTEGELVLAQEFFNSNNYYSFSIYRKLLPRENDESFSFTDCLKLFNFNDFLRENLNKFTGYIELMMRSTFLEHTGAYYEKEKNKLNAEELSTLHKKGFFIYDTPEAYLDSIFYKLVDDKETEDSLEIRYAFLEKIKESKSEAVLHYKNKNTGIPFWVLIEECTYGNIFHLIVNLDTDIFNHWVDNAFEKSLRGFITSWFRCINFLRNDCAHYNRLYGRFFNVSAPRLVSEDKKRANIKADNNKTLFALMLTIKNLLVFHVNAIETWDNFIELLDEEIKSNGKVVRIEKMGFPPNWKECLHSQTFNDNLKRSFYSFPYKDTNYHLKLI